MKKKSEYANALDDMFSEDEKKRLAAVKMIKDIAATIGPVRVRNELIGFLSEFLDDEIPIMNAVLEELTNFTHLLGGTEFQKCILPLLTSFCKLDEKQVAIKALSIMNPILERHPDQNLQIIRKLSKTNMNVSKECAAKLIVSGVKIVPHLEATLLEIYSSFIFSQNPSVRIIAAKYLKDLTERVKNQDEIMKIVELIFNDSEDLVKLLCIDTLILLYKSNPNLVMNKLKYLFSLNTWRINLKLCEMGYKFAEVLSKTHFKVLIEPSFLKLLATDDDQIRAASCSTLIPLAKSMNSQQIQTKLSPLLKKLSADKVEFVRVQFATNLVKMCPSLSHDQMKDLAFPIIIEIIKENNIELSYGILNHFEAITDYMSEDKQENWLFNPLKEQLQNGNWRIKTRIIEILGRIILKQKKIPQSIMRFFFNFIEDKIEAVRVQAVNAIANIIRKHCANEIECDVLGQLIRLKGHPSYLIRQKILAIIEKSLDFANQKYLNDYKKTIIMYLSDQVPNIKLKTIKILSENKKLSDKIIDKEIQKTKEDPDIEVQRAAKALKI